MNGCQPRKEKILSASRRMVEMNKRPKRAHSIIQITCWWNRAEIGCAGFWDALRFRNHLIRKYRLPLVKRRFEASEMHFGRTDLLWVGCLIDRSAMDGYAPKAEETFGASKYAPLSLSCWSHTRTRFEQTVDSGQAVRIRPVGSGSRCDPGRRTRRITGRPDPCPGARSSGEAHWLLRRDIRAGAPLLNQEETSSPGYRPLSSAAWGVCGPSPIIDFLITETNCFTRSAAGSLHCWLNSLMSTTCREGWSEIGKILHLRMNAKPSAKLRSNRKPIYLCHRGHIGWAGRSCSHAFGRNRHFAGSRHPHAPAVSTGFGLIGLRKVFSCRETQFHVFPHMTALSALLYVAWEGFSEDWPYRKTNFRCGQKSLLKLVGSNTSVNSRRKSRTDCLGERRFFLPLPALTAFCLPKNLLRICWGGYGACFAIETNRMLWWNKNSQFASAEEALKKFRDVVNPAPLGEEQILLKEARGRVLSRCDRFDQRSLLRPDNFDGYAVRAEDTSALGNRFWAQTESWNPGLEYSWRTTLPGTATPISTGGYWGADGVVMIENTHPDGTWSVFWSRSFQEEELLQDPTGCREGYRRDLRFRETEPLQPLKPMSGFGKPVSSGGFDGRRTDCSRRTHAAWTFYDQYLPYLGTQQRNWAVRWNFWELSG